MGQLLGFAANAVGSGAIKLAAKDRTEVGGVCDDACSGAYNEGVGVGSSVRRPGNADEGI